MFVANWLHIARYCLLINGPYLLPFLLVVNYIIYCVSDLAL